MQTPTKTLPAQKRRSEIREGLFCLFLVLFALFEIVLVTVVLARSFDAASKGKEPIAKEEESTAPPIVEEPRLVPVFAGGEIPTALVADGDTKTISVDQIYSQYAILVNAETGKIVAQKDANTSFEPASMTKVMTLIVACEALTTEDLDKKLTMTEEIYNNARAGGYAGSTCYGIDVGDQYSVRDLLYGIGMESASDCVLPIVYHISDSEAAFVELMNQKAAELGLSGTHFDNAIGHESENNVTTAADMAQIMSYAMQSDLITDILGKTHHASTAAGFKSTGEWLPSFSFSYYSTLFRSRMETYKKHANKDFTLATTTLKAGKTGSFISSSYVVCMARDKSGTDYILVLGAAEADSKPASYRTMCDIQTVLDAYIK